MAGIEVTGKLLIECEHGDIVVDNATKVILEARPDALGSLVGVEVYLAGKKVYSVASARPIAALGAIVKHTTVE
jgi:hypothetical protein